MIWVFISSLFLAQALEWILDPGYYFSVKNLQKTANFGLMWGAEYKMNHEITEEHVHLSVPVADPGKVYVQKALDSRLAVEITQTWQIEAGGWEMTFKGVHKPKNANVKEKLVNLVFYIALSNETLTYQDEKWSGSFPFSFESSSPPIIRALNTNSIQEKSWKVKKFVQKWLFDSHSQKKPLYGDLPASIEDSSNFIFIQLQSSSPFSFSIKYGDCCSNPLDSSLSSFSSQFSSSLGTPSNFTSNILSYLLSGLSLLSGPIKIIENNEIKSGFEGDLLTFVPSRASFPRGFLWDEGFHLLVVELWDLELALKVLNSWMETVDSNGWIPREQIRGPAAETRVPEQFIPQSKDIANPPSFVFFLENVLRRVKNLPPENLVLKKEFLTLRKIYPKLKKWLSWIIDTQKNKEMIPMWKGRTAGHNLASGLDDYPRGLQVSDLERHLDLYMWQLKFTEVMKDLSSLLSNQEDFEVYSKQMRNLKALEEKFLDSSEIFRDFLSFQFLDKEGKQAYLWRGDNKCGNVLNPLGSPAECNPYSDMPCCSEFGWCGNTPGHCQCDKCKKAEKLENRGNLKRKEIFSPHIGYVNLMPLIVGYVKIGSFQYNKILDFIRDPEVLWSEFGLRSLAKNDLLFKTGENYWKGEIWINFNFMVLRAFKLYYWEDIRAQETYSNLRENLIKTIEKSWEKTGYLWEQYQESNGSGQRVHPFTGWSSLVLNIYYEKF
jgi:hypothetical protein